MFSHDTANCTICDFYEKSYKQKSHLTPRVTRYAELGGSCNSEVNKGNHARPGSVLFDFSCDLKVESKTVGVLVIQYIDKETLHAKCTFFYGNIDMLYSFKHRIILHVGR